MYTVYCRYERTIHITEACVGRFVLRYRLSLVVEVVVENGFNIKSKVTLDLKTVKYRRYKIQVITGVTSEITLKYHYFIPGYPRSRYSVLYLILILMLPFYFVLVLLRLDVPRIPEMNLAFAISARAVDDETNFEKMKDILKAIVQKFGSNRIHYSVITFGDSPITELPFNRRLPSDEDLERFIGKC